MAVYFIYEYEAVWLNTNGMFVGPFKAEDDAPLFYRHVKLGFYIPGEFL